MKLIFKKYKLNNGIDIIFIPQNNSLSVSIGIFAKTGADYEKKNENGISHFLEHMFFKGTKMRPSKIDIASEMESLGAIFNAFTDRDITGYFVKVSKNNFNKAFDIVSDIYLNSIFPKEEIDKERGVIIEEKHMYDDDPESKVLENLNTMMYKGHPIGRPIIGSYETINSISRNMLVNYYNRHYTSNKTVIVIAGNVNVSKALNLIKNSFSEFKKGENYKVDKIKSTKRKLDISIEYRKLDQTNLAIGMHSVPYKDKMRYDFILLSNILGNGMSSRLFQKIREELGIAYKVSSNNYSYMSHGEFVISAGLKSDSVDRSIKIIFDELKNIAKFGPSDKELNRVKKYVSGKFALSLETSSSLMFFYARQFIYSNKMENISDIMNNIKNVSKLDIKKAAEFLLEKSGYFISIVGKHKNTRSFYKSVSL